MTLSVFDASGRLSEFHAIPEPIDSGAPHEPTRWSALFEAAALDMNSFTPVEPKWNPIVFADERAAWEGRPADRPDLTFRVEAAAYHGRPVFFAISRAVDALRPFGACRAVADSTRAIEWLASLIMPGLMLAGAVLARHNVKLQRGDRVGAFRAASILFITSLMAWVLGSTHVSDVGVEINRLFQAVGSGLLDAAILWLTYLGLEPYVRRTSPDSLIGWTRLIAGRWNDPHVGRDVLIGASAGLLMTVLFPLYYLLPPLFGGPEPIPVLPDLRPLMGVRHVLGGLVLQVSSAISNAMLGTVGLASLRHPLQATHPGDRRGDPLLHSRRGERHVQPGLPDAGARAGSCDDRHLRLRDRSSRAARGRLPHSPFTSSCCVHRSRRISRRGGDRSVSGIWQPSPRSDSARAISHARQRWRSPRGATHCRARDVAAQTLSGGSRDSAAVVSFSSAPESVPECPAIRRIRADG